MTYAIVTGISKGLGAATAQMLLQNGTNVIGLSRTDNETLHSIAEQHGTRFVYFECDLSRLEEIEHVFASITQMLDASGIDRLYLINNAGVVEPIHHAAQVENEDLKWHVMINTVAPMVLMNMSLKWAGEHDVHLIGVTITSGAADRAVYGWSAYCSTKASINRYTETVALEQETLGTTHKIFAFSPGVMDTDMQGEIRQTSKEAFVERDQFRSYKANQMLNSPESVAEVLVDILRDGANIVNGRIYSIREYL